MTGYVLGVGTNSVDQVLKIACSMAALLDTPKTRVEERWTLSGGQTATFCCACAAFGLKTAYAGAFGSDQNGTLIRDAMIVAGVDITHSVQLDQPNRDAVIILDEAGRRTVLWHRTDRLRLDCERLAKSIGLSQLVHVDDDDPDLAISAADQARARGVPVTSDIEHSTARTEELIRQVTYPIFDDTLPGKLTGEADPERALRKLRPLNPGLLCMTLGERGAAALDGDRFRLSEAFKVPVVDTTGAGDVFRAGFAYGLLQKWEVGDILRFANAAGAVACTKLGAFGGVPRLKDVEQLLVPDSRSNS